MADVLINPKTGRPWYEPSEWLCAVAMASQAVDSPYRVDSMVGDVRILARQFLRAIELAPGVVFNSKIAD